MTMPDDEKTVLDKETVAGLRLGRGKTDQIWFDDELPGFGVRLRAGGKKTWVVQYRVGALQKRLTLGSVAVLNANKAREAAKAEIARVTLGGDPQAKKAEEKARAKHTLGAVAERYLKHQQSSLKPKTHAEAGRYLRKLWKSLHDIPLHKITRLHVTTRVSELKVESGPSAAGHARLVLSAMFAWAIGEGLAEDNPVIGSNAPATKARDRVLSAGFDKGRKLNLALNELGEIWRAVPDNDYGRIVKLLALTGQRRGEVGGMRWSELDTDGAVWQLPEGRTKNGLPHAVPLTPLALAIIKAVPQEAERDLLFGRGPNGFSGWGKPKEALDARIQAARKKAGAKPMPPWTVHDIRRATATGLGNLGVLPHVVEALLNHISGFRKGVAGTYNLSPYAREVRPALLLWDEHVRALTGGTATVVAFQTRAAPNLSVLPKKPRASSKPRTAIVGAWNSA
jgi:integrase